MSINNDRCDNLQRTPEYVESRGAECMLPALYTVAKAGSRSPSEPTLRGLKGLIRSARTAWKSELSTASPMADLRSNAEGSSPGIIPRGLLSSHCSDQVSGNWFRRSTCVYRKIPFDPDGPAAVPPPPVATAAAVRQRRSHGHGPDVTSRIVDMAGNAIFPSSNGEVGAKPPSPPRSRTNVEAVGRRSWLGPIHDKAPRETHTAKQGCGILQN
jgi:hypothetical protein